MKAKKSIFRLLVEREWMSLVDYAAGSAAATLYTICAMIIFWNVLLGTFNLIPIPPLDGSKLLYAFFRIRTETQYFLEQWGFFIILALLFIPPFGFIFAHIVYSVLSFFGIISFL